MASTKRKKAKRKPKEHPLVTAIRKVYEDQIGVRETVIDMMYAECVDISEKNEKHLREYIR